MGYLVFVAGTLAVLGDGLQGLPHQVHVALINVKAQQAEASGGASADAIQELESLAHQVVVCLVVLAAQEVLSRAERIEVSPPAISATLELGVLERTAASTCRSELWFSQRSCR